MQASVYLALSDDGAHGRIVLSMGGEATDESRHHYEPYPDAAMATTSPL
jgi:hypothetical protein